MHVLFKNSLLVGKWSERVLTRALKSIRGPLAAVNVVYRRRPGSVEILLVKRRLSPKDPWSGDIGFPGGGVKFGESPWQAALRETFEEVGIRPEDIVIESSLGVERTSALPGLKVFVYLSRLIGTSNISLNYYELADVWWVPLNEIRGPSRMFHAFKGRIVEAYVFPGGLVWGLSKRVLDRVMTVLNYMNL